MRLCLTPTIRSELWSHITDDQGIYPKLLDAGFIDVYKLKPYA